MVTGNKLKIDGARERLEPYSIQVIQEKLTIIEPQEESIQKVAEAKASQAFKLLNKPVLISDTGWNISSLNGFPGPFMHYINDWLTVDDLLNLTRDKSDRIVYIENVAVYRDEKIIKSFISKRKGKLLTEAYKNGRGIDQIVTFRSDNKSKAECQELGIEYHEDDVKSIWTQFGEWFRTY